MFFVFRRGALCYDIVLAVGRLQLQYAGVWCRIGAVWIVVIVVELQCAGFAASCWIDDDWVVEFGLLVELITD